MHEGTEAAELTGVSDLNGYLEPGSSSAANDRTLVLNCPCSAKTRTCATRSSSLTPPAGGGTAQPADHRAPVRPPTQGIGDPGHRAGTPSCLQAETAPAISQLTINYTSPDSTGTARPKPDRLAVTLLGC